MNMVKNLCQPARLLPPELEELLGPDDLKYARDKANVGPRQARNLMAGKSKNFIFLKALMERIRANEQLMIEVELTTQRIKGMQSIGNMGQQPLQKNVTPNAG